MASLCSSNINVPRSVAAFIPSKSHPLTHKLPARFSQLSMKPVSRQNRHCSVVIALANEGRDNLDHLKRVTKVPQNNQQPPRRTQPAPPPPQPVGLWDRFPTARTMQQMLDTMERLVEDPLAYNGGWTSPASLERGGYSRGRTPWEIKEAEGVYKMRFDMPGMTKQDVKVWVEENMLVLKGEKLVKNKENGEKEEEEEEEEWSAKSYGKYSCRIALPENVQFDKIKAEVKDGVLYITIPKATISSKIMDINVE